MATRRIVTTPGYTPTTIPAVGRGAQYQAQAPFRRKQRVKEQKDAFAKELSLAIRAMFWKVGVAMMFVVLFTVALYVFVGSTAAGISGGLLTLFVLSFSGTYLAIKSRPPKRARAKKYY